MGGTDTVHRSHRLTAAPILVLSLALTGAAGAQSTSESPPTSAPASAPQIVSVAINPDPVHAGKSVDAIVETTPDVVAVQAHVMNLKIDIPRDKDGAFRKSAKVPWMARFFKGTYKVTFVATCKDGHEAQSEQDVVLN